MIANASLAHPDLRLNSLFGAGSSILGCSSFRCAVASLDWNCFYANLLGFLLRAFCKRGTYLRYFLCNVFWRVLTLPKAGFRLNCKADRITTIEKGSALQRRFTEDNYVCQANSLFTSTYCKICLQIKPQISFNL